MKCRFTNSTAKGAGRIASYWSGRGIGRASNVRNAGRNSLRRNFPLLQPVANRRILRQLAREFQQTVVGVAQLDFSYR